MKKKSLSRACGASGDVLAVSGRRKGQEKFSSSRVDAVGVDGKCACINGLPFCLQSIPPVPLRSPRGGGGGCLPFCLLAAVTVQAPVTGEAWRALARERGPAFCFCFSRCDSGDLSGRAEGAPLRGINARASRAHMRRGRPVNFLPFFFFFLFFFLRRPGKRCAASVSRRSLGKIIRVERENYT